MRVAKVAAQAKLNLVLRVFEREATGYHKIFTVFHRIDLADDIVVRAGGSVRTLDSSGPRLPSAGLGPPEDNLAYRAALEYATRKGGSWPRGFAIEVTKRIPVGAGLGGGSADAGAVLRALNALAPDPMTDEELWITACGLGSDVPFLAMDYPAAQGTDRGTQLIAIPPLPESSVIIAVPSFGIRTADAYRWLDEDREQSGWQPQPQLDVRLGANDFQPVIEQRHPELRRIRERFQDKGARMALLAGSGSCVFALFDDLSPTFSEPGIDAEIIATQTSARVVQVEVLE